MLESKIANVVVDQIYTGKTLVELAKDHEVDITELRQVERAETWNLCRRLALGEICRIRVAQNEGLLPKEFLNEADKKVVPPTPATQEDTAKETAKKQ